jgi:hypothetical protein
MFSSTVAILYRVRTTQMNDRVDYAVSSTGAIHVFRMREMLLGFLTSAALYTVAELDAPTAVLAGPLL